MCGTAERILPVHWIRYDIGIKNGGFLVLLKNKAEEVMNLPRKIPAT